MPTHTKTDHSSPGSKSKFKLLKNKIISNLGSNQSAWGFIKSGVHYLVKKSIISRIANIPRKIIKMIYLWVEKGNVVIYNGDDLSLIHSKDPYKFWLYKNTVKRSDIPLIKKEISSFKTRPQFHILLFVNAAGVLLQNTIKSLAEQVYPDWKLHIVTDTAETKEAVKAITGADLRIHQNTEVVISVKDLTCSDTGIDQAVYILNIKQGDTLTPDACYSFAKTAISFPETDIIYSDEDLQKADGSFHDPCFKPDWSPDDLLSVNYIRQAVIFKHALLQKIEGWLNIIQDERAYDLLLKATELTNKEILHLPRLLYHAFEENKETKAKRYKKDQAALTEALNRRKEQGYVIDSPVVEGIFIPRYTLHSKDVKVSIIIPTKDKTDILKVCIDSIVQKSTYKNYEIILIDNNSSTPEFFTQVKEWEQSMPGVFNCIRTEKPFNFAYLMNLGASNSTGDFYILLNNDTEVITPDWIELLMEQAQRSSIGIAGAKLLYPDNTVQHAGVVIGLGELADHVFVGVPRDGNTYQDYLHRVINYSALTAACMMVSKQKFHQVNGFNESFEVEYNDIDFCLRLKEEGYNHVYLPHVELYHHESISRGHPYATKESYERHVREFNLMKNTWKKYIENDPCYNPHLSLKHKDMRVSGE